MAMMVRTAAAMCLMACGMATAQDAPVEGAVPAPQPAPRSAPSAEDLRAQREWEAAMSIVQKRFLRPVTREQLQRRALALLLRDLDPYSNYLSPAELEDFLNQNADGGFVGIGVQLEQDEQRKLPRVARLFAGSPALRSGVARGDWLLSANGDSLADKSFDDVRARLVGAPGSPVELRVRRAGTGLEETLSLVRQRVPIPSVRGVRSRPDGSQDFLLDTSRHIGYVRVSRLAQDTAPAMEAALGALRAQHARGLVLDLRDCTGGLMKGALAVADMFIDQGRLLSVAENGVEHHHDATPGVRWEGPLVVLVNEGTASSGEILAGALKDSGNARLAGSRTFGKGRIQVMYRLGEGMGGVLVSTGTFKRPNGQTVDRHDVPAGSDLAGIRPDAGHEVAVSKEARAAVQRFQDLLDSHALLTEAELAARPHDVVLAHALAWLLAPPGTATVR